MAKREMCATCECWDPSVEGLNKGEIGDCRRHPPLIQPMLLKREINVHLPQPGDEEGLEISIYGASAFPMTYRESWCGEFRWEPGEEPITGC